MKKFSPVIIVLAILIFSACAPRLGLAPEPSMVEQPLYAEEYRADEAASNTADVEMMEGDLPEAGGGGNGVASNVPAQERLIIQNADLSIIVTDPEDKMNAVADLAENLGGFIVSMNMYQTYTPNGELVPEAYITVRVPAASLDQALSQIKADVIEVRNESRSGQDVTQEYVDLASRLDALEAAERELLAIMEQAKSSEGNNTTTMTQDVLTVYNRIIEIREQIEQIKGRMQYFEQSAAFSAISLTIIAQETIQPLKIGPWTPAGAARDAIQALINFLQNFVDFVIWFAIFVLPMLVVVFGPIALIIWGIVSLVKRRKAKKAKNTAEK